LLLREKYFRHSPLTNACADSGQRRALKREGESKGFADARRNVTAADHGPSPKP
jgi:hypothetical protein